MSLPIRRIPVAVADGTARRVTRRAGDLALESGAKIELFSVVRPELRVVGIPDATLVQINRLIIDTRQREPKTRGQRSALRATARRVSRRLSTVGALRLPTRTRAHGSEERTSGK